MNPGPSEGSDFCMNALVPGMPPTRAGMLGCGAPQRSASALPSVWNGDSRVGGFAAACPRSGGALRSSTSDPHGRPPPPRGALDGGATLRVLSASVSWSDPQGRPVRFCCWSGSRAIAAPWLPREACAAAPQRAVSAPASVWKGDSRPRGFSAPWPREACGGAPRRESASEPHGKPPPPREALDGGAALRVLSAAVSSSDPQGRPERCVRFWGYVGPPLSRPGGPCECCMCEAPMFIELPAGGRLERIVGGAAAGALLGGAPLPPSNSSVAKGEGLADPPRLRRPCCGCGASPKSASDPQGAGRCCAMLVR